VECDTGGSKAILIDFAMARKISQKSSFVGTPNYLHRNLFECFLQDRKQHKVQESHDFAALGFTLAYFIHCRQTWSVGRYPQSVTNVTEEEKVLLKSTMDGRFNDAHTASNGYGEVQRLLIHDLPIQ
jgi:hypothetical protein